MATGRYPKRKIKNGGRLEATNMINNMKII